MDVLRPFLMLASAAFVTGFAGYLAMAGVGEMGTPDASWQAPITATAPMAPNGWNVAKRI